MTSLLTNNAALTALTTLRTINQSLDVTSKRVATGQRVSDSADNAAYWSIATGIRTNNASLGAIKDSLGLGASAVDTAYNGLTSALSDLQNLRAKLQTALPPGGDRTKAQTEIAAIRDKMRATASSSTATGQNWLAADSSPGNAAYQPVQNGVARFSRDRTGTVTFSRIAIDGQKSFVDTPMKANDRTIGILVDSEVEEESTKLKALQTQRHLAVQALSIANGASAGVPSLFR